MSIISVHRPPVKPTRRTPRPSAPFGAGISPRPTRFEPSEDDRRWAAQVSNSDPEIDLDTLAGESACVDAMGALAPLPVDLCRSCGQPAEIDRDGWCAECAAYADRVATTY